MHKTTNEKSTRLQRCLKPKAAAQYLGISTRTLHDLAADGRIPFHKVSARLHLFDIKDLDAFLEKCRIRGGAE